MSNTHLDNNDRTMLRLAKGQAVYAPTIIVHPQKSTLVALQMFGPELAVKANWAALMNNNRAYHRLLGSTITMNGSKEHATLKKMLPCGWLEMWLIHQQASYQTLTPADTRIYFLEQQAESTEASTAVSSPGSHAPNHFFLFLNKMLATPLLPSWSHYLWHCGRQNNTIHPISPFDRNGRFLAYVINTKEQTWQTHIQHGLATRQISF
ncbi:MAG: hypothetical protein KDE56_06820 [Anaerolineales bacterium]|nr:hypothetical protein [Anaerolineales bacterium]